VLLFRPIHHVMALLILCRNNILPNDRLQAEGCRDDRPPQSRSCGEISRSGSVSSDKIPAYRQLQTSQRAPKATGVNRISINVWDVVAVFNSVSFSNCSISVRQSTFRYLSRDKMSPGSAQAKNKGPKACTTCAKAKARCVPGPLGSLKCDR
jgi:hypothetical protein